MSAELKVIYEVTKKIQSCFAEINGIISNFLKDKQSIVEKQKLENLHKREQKSLKQIFKEKCKTQEKKVIHQYHNDIQTEKGKMKKQKGQTFNKKDKTKDGKPLKMRKLKRIKKNSQEPAVKRFNPFLMFCKQQSAFVRQAYPSLSLMQCGSILGNLWRQLEPEERQIYYEMQKQAKRENQKAMNQLKQKSKQSDQGPQKSTKEPKIEEGLQI